MVKKVDTPQNQRGFNCFCITKMCLFVLKPVKLIEQVLIITQIKLSSLIVTAWNNLSGVAVQLATQLGASPTL